ncbi:MAG: tetratricopeptide repeat protein, partial [Pseudomonadota bacterium]
MKKQTPAPNKPLNKKPSAKNKAFALSNYFPLKPMHCYGVIAALTFLLYVNSLWNDYTLDDSIVIKENMFTQKGFAGIKDILTSDVFVGFFKTEKNLVAGGRYRPLSVVTFAIEHQLFGDNASISHLINLLLYALTGIAIFLFLTRLFSQSKFNFSNWLPLISALLFIAHPLHTEAVTNIKGRDEIMTLLFSVLAANYFLKYYDSQKKISLLIASVCFFAALLSKENAITWIAIFPLLFYFFRDFDFKKSILPFIFS